MANFDFSHVTLDGKKIDTGEKKKGLFECSKEEFFDRLINEALKGKARCIDMYLSTKDDGWLDLAYSYDVKIKEWTVRRHINKGLIKALFSFCIFFERRYGTVKLANLTDEELQRISLMKTRKGTATSEAKRAQQILYTRNISHGGFGVGSGGAISSHLDCNPERPWKEGKADG